MTLETEGRCPLCKRAMTHGISLTGERKSYRRRRLVEYRWGVRCEKRVKILWIPILTKDLQQDLGEWLCTSPQGGEEAVRSYIIRHPEKVEPRLGFLSVELYLGPRLRADLLFRKEKKYYIVETKYGRWSEERVREKVLRYRDALIETLKKKKVDFEEVIPVVIASVEVLPLRRRCAIWYRKKSGS